MPAATTDVRTRRREQTRKEILAAAWRLAERDGISALSLRELAADVGMRAPSLYTYFDSKAAIYDEMFSAGYRALDAAMTQLTVDPDHPVDTIAAHVGAFVDFCKASVPRYQLLFTRAVPDWEPSADAYAVSVTSYERMAGQMSQLGFDDPRDLDLLTALATGLASQQLANDPGGTRWRDRSLDAARMLLAHIRRAG